MINVERRPWESYDDWYLRWLAERAKLEHERAKTVVCELCQTGHHRSCVRPCTCRDGHRPASVAVSG